MLIVPTTDTLSEEKPTAETSILFRQPTVLQKTPAPYFVDLGLDRYVAAATEGHEFFRLATYFYSPLSDADDIIFRQSAFSEVMSIRHILTPFSSSLKQMRDRIRLRDKMSHPLQKVALHVEAADLYIGAVDTLLAAISKTPVSSSALDLYFDALRTFSESDDYRSLRSETRLVLQTFTEIRYTVNLWTGHLTVSPYQDLPDLTAEVELTFARFQQGTAKDYRIKVGETLELNHVETEILERVEQLHPEPFELLNKFASRTRDGFPAALLTNFDRELAFLFACNDVAEPLQAVGLTLTMPRLATEKRVSASHSFDIALALKLTSEASAVITNNFSLEPPEQFLVVTGPNQGGKTTFARMFGSMHYLAMLGIPVPGSDVELPVPDRIFTHFEREEDAHSGHGKLEDELLRIYQIITFATERSVVIVNEMFASTTLADSIDLGTRVMGQLIQIGAVGVCVTFVDELSSLSRSTVSLVANVIREPPNTPTFTLDRRAADGVAYALAIASRHGLTFDQLSSRLP